MPLKSGQTLLHYRLVDKLGEGAMGMVWKAVDTTLNREVAIKLLPEFFAHDSDRLSRFEREAKLLASLNHPNIASVYGLHRAGDTHFLAMELVQGEDLQRQLCRGPLSCDQALHVAIQIAAGMEAAHGNGVIHRDLKPANIVVTPEGHVKVLDFGLAKSLAGDADGMDLTHSPTVTSVGSVAGSILGTASYMSPEQARGQTLDQRTDVWAFGCVLYELLVGGKPFGGDTMTDVLAAIVRAEPDWEVLGARVTQRLVRVVQRCLRKNPRDRVRDLGDIGLVLKEIAEGDATPESASPALSAESENTRRPGVSGNLAAGLVLGAALVAAGLGYWATNPDPVAQPQRRLSIQLPEGTVLPTGAGTDLALSPDGETLVYVSEDAGERRLYLRRMNEFTTRPIPGSEGASDPFFSPDSSWIGFGFGEGMKKVSLAGLTIYPLCDLCANGAWDDEGNVLFSHKERLWRIPEAGGERQLVAEPSPEIGVTSIFRAEALPGSKAAIFEIGYLGFGGVGVVSLESGEVARITEHGSDPFYSPTGHIIFARESTLLAVPFDLERLEVTGRETHVMQGVRVENGGAVQAALADDGMLVYAPAGTVMGTQLTWVDRKGNTEPVNDQWRIFSAPRVSPNGEQIAVVVNERGRFDIWIADIGSGGLRPLTRTGEALAPVWTPDGTRVTFAAESTESYSIQWAPADGSGPAETLLVAEHPIRPEAWHPDGNRLIYREIAGSTDLLVFELSNESRTPLLDSEASEHSAALSHDGRRLAYVSDEGGTGQVYLRPFPGPGPEVPVSIEGGEAPMWSHDDSEILYRQWLSGVGRFLTASVQDLRITARGDSFELSSFWGAPVRAHADAHPDGRRFLVLKKGEALTRPRIHVVLNWFEELRRKAPSER